MSENEFKLPQGWLRDGSLLYRPYLNPKPSRAFAIFDMDNTLMVTPSYYVEELARGMDLPKAKPAIENDYVLFAPNVREKLQTEHSNGRGVLIFSNQRGMLNNVPLAYVIIARIELLLKDLDVPLYIILATEHNICRKPGPGMLLYYEKHLNGGIKVDRKSSIYVGDAAGRKQTRETAKIMMQNLLHMLKSTDFTDHKYKQKDKNGNLIPVDAESIIKKLTISKLRNWMVSDFSDCDLKFALNNDIPFNTPDEYFYGLDQPTPVIDLVPSEIGSQPFFPPISNGLIIIVGPPSSGKTFFCANLFPNFVRITPDDFPTLEACNKEIAKILKTGKNVIIDGTNHLYKIRASFIKTGKGAGVTVSLVYINVKLPFPTHVNKLKMMLSDEFSIGLIGETLKPVPSIVYGKGKITTYFRNLQPPSLDEGMEGLFTLSETTFPFTHNAFSKIYLP
ncbi:polynucleotide kinase- 3'-phosphatase, putative [Theileria equi strain WA]|uniref:Polynucleotide kinase-3'-phosphatase, putative n=1 Tax=Theileria equi strain WA TaxID=1537102 RepID=L0AY91_THEEQ|nr:polynucleotide kinase- 3'-phosphatase, putative [Theileria equi strain WA]AFZ80530.1 polynucleotide kinase- 3'-phosphatase, putative [Theileria equi strain WA]|eukprot:XP_004830196.1 polynucleotide kinase- 3'-phosphatase, putative [Theileria equi strain WA]